MTRLIRDIAHDLGLDPTAVRRAVLKHPRVTDRRQLTVLVWRYLVGGPCPI